MSDEEWIESLRLLQQMSEEWVEYDGGVVQDRHRSASQIRVAPGVTVIPERAFEDCEELMVVNLTNVSTISSLAFVGCESLERVLWTDASSVEIGDNAFCCCARLEEIDLSNVTEKIGVGAFYACKALQRVTIPSTVTDIGSGAFEECYLEEVNLNDGLQCIGRDAFAFCHQVRDVVLPEGLQAIGAGAFAYWRSLERITIPSSVTDIGSCAFEHCSNLSEMTLREGVQYIDIYPFHGGTALENINIPPVAFVVDIWRSSCQLLRATMPVTQYGRELVVSRWMQYRSPGQLEQAEAKVNEILRNREQTGEEKIQCIRDWFAYYDLVDVTTMLELAIWRVNMDGNEEDEEARQAIRRICGRDMNVITYCDMLDVTTMLELAIRRVTEARQAVRRNCGSDMNIIIPGVLSYLEKE